MIKNRARRQDQSNRRETLRLFGAAGVTALVGCGSEAEPGAGTGARAPDAGIPAPADASAISCVVRPTQIEGPYFLDEKLNRADIRSDPTDSSVKPGVILRLGFRVYRIDGSACTPLSGALVDLWQCDALGIYAGVQDIAGMFNTTGKKFLRGYQVVSAAGAADFITIFPGWYTGRAIHNHFKIRTMTPSGRAFEYVSQLYFPEDVISAVLATPVYAGHGRPDTPNARDGGFATGGSQLVPRMTMQADGSYDALFDIGLQIT